MDISAKLLIQLRGHSPEAKFSMKSKMFVYLLYVKETRQTSEFQF